MNTRIKQGIARISLAAILIPGIGSSAAAQSFTNLHSLVFTDGTGPVAGMILSGNTLYGTTRTYGGGAAGGAGSVFKMNTDGSGFTNLHTFSEIAPEGGDLNGGVVLSGSNLYGTALFGGASNLGCVFVINTNGLGSTNLINFTNSTINGAYPAGGVVLAGGTFYGTAEEGGAENWGTLFAVNADGTGFTNLHGFNVTNGQYPAPDLIVSGGSLYGVTPDGGGSRYGTIFSLSTNGTGYTNFYSFSPESGSPGTNSDGAFPLCKLVLAGGTLYGTTTEGGNAGGGTIFMISTNGTNFSVLHHFTATNGPLATNYDGAKPQSGLTLFSNVLYGTTSAGGSGGNGTVFEINTDGSGFRSLYSFSATNNANATNLDGAVPIGGLLYARGALYGTTSTGGTAGYGTIYSIVLPPTLNIALAGTNVVLTWPSNVAGFNLQWATNLTPPGNWNGLAGQYVVTNAASGSQKFYRLKYP